MKTIEDWQIYNVVRGTYCMGLYKTYKEYIKSEHWREIREKLIKKYCQRCGIEKFRIEIINNCPYKWCQNKFSCNHYIKKEIGKRLHLHHLNYKNCGNESEKDVMTLCEDCHLEEHTTYKE